MSVTFLLEILFLKSTSCYFPFLELLSLSSCICFFQKRQAQSNSKSRSEKFNPHQEEVASGFPIEPPRISQAREDSGISRHGHHHKRASHSGPLVNPAAWVKAGKNMDDVSKVSNGAEISTLSGPMAARRSFLSEDKREKSSSLQSGAPKLVSRFPGSFKEVSSESMKRRDQMQGPANSHQNEDGRSSNKDPVLVSSFFISFSLCQLHVNLSTKPSLINWILVHPKTFNFT